MLSSSADLPASFGPEIRMLPRCGKYRSIRRKSLKRSTVKCFKIIIASTPLAGQADKSAVAKVLTGSLGDFLGAPLHRSPGARQVGVVAGPTFWFSFCPELSEVPLS